MTDGNSVNPWTRINKLLGAEDYPVWKLQMMDILTLQDEWDHIDPGTAPTKAEDAVIRLHSYTVNKRINFST